MILKRGRALDREDMGIGHTRITRVEWFGLILVMALLVSLVALAAFGWDLGSVPIGLDPNGSIGYEGG